MEYKWNVLSNTTLGVLIGMMNSTVLLIALPAIFKGININPLLPSSFSYLLWLLMGYGVTTSALVVSIGRLSDIYGRVKLYRLGFIIFTIGSILLSITFGKGDFAASELIAFRVIQAIGGSLLMANSTALITDAFPLTERGKALGLNQISGLLGSILGLIVGGILATINWRLVFLISVPFGIIGTIWSYKSLKEIGIRNRNEKIDIIGNIDFILGIVLLLTGITYALEPYKNYPLGWYNPMVIGLLISGAALLAIFPFIEMKVKYPMFRLELFKSRLFSAGIFAALLAGLAYGGLMITLVVLLQGIWLPLHGYSFSVTPLWAGIYMIPLMLGFVAFGPISGALSDKHGARGLATGGMIVVLISFLLLITLKYDFPYPEFAFFIFLAGAGNGLFVAPNTASIMNSVPANHRGVASGMRAVMTNIANTTSIALYFSLLLSAFEAKLPNTLYTALISAGFPNNIAYMISKMPPTAALFAAFLGYNPMQSVLSSLPNLASQLGNSDPSGLSEVLSNTWFPKVIAPAFMYALRSVLLISSIIIIIAAIASALRGKHNLNNLNNTNN
ncbi:arabinose efflux permease family protein [Caldisphaera lagunensis DSM 15908]|uniref:Arabinose efflux permease family protein n=1 Tax=Caldisphaera lagunensis (strain DSM 15908 / JCM 11604 / ANMR 0165 / IC-154) TaxID=1056495 RepID=L0A9W8_CALLD|nr:MFS transporter [Caldisphaera lagunensis]AFZ70688.1 arabinose efflux permease family protein [Caldisphaera lagunensis DSM 15908]